MSLLRGLLTGPSRQLWTVLGILLCTLALTAIGIVFVESTTMDLKGPFTLKQTLFAVLGTLVLVIVITVDYRQLERWSFVIYGGMLLLLFVLLIAGRVGIDRWLLPGKSMQPSELMKVVLVITLAQYLRFRKDQRSLVGLLRPIFLTLVPMFLVLGQPDLGTSLMLPPVLLAMLFVSGARRAHLIVALTLGALLIPGALLVHKYHEYIPFSETIIKPYQVKRITSFLKRDDRLKDGYQLDQSVIAFGSGGVTGKGWANGTQNRLKFVPAKHTDFIFSIIGEEWGFVGTSWVVLLYLGLVLLCIQVAVQTREPFGRLVATGIATLLAAQGMQNIGMTLGLTPITGLPLPFVSYGGSSLLTSFLAVGLVLNIGMRRVIVMASQDLNPEDDRRIISVVDDRAAGATMWPDGHY
jgi:rod shape determining protein RodA